MVFQGFVLFVGKALHHDFILLFFSQKIPKFAKCEVFARRYSLGSEQASPGLSKSAHPPVQAAFPNHSAGAMPDSKYPFLLSYSSLSLLPCPLLRETMAPMCIHQEILQRTPLPFSHCGGLTLAACWTCTQMFSHSHSSTGRGNNMKKSHGSR